MIEDLSARPWHTGPLRESVDRWVDAQLDETHQAVVARDRGIGIQETSAVNRSRRTYLAAPEACASVTRVSDYPRIYYTTRPPADHERRVARAGAEGSRGREQPPDRVEDSGSQEGATTPSMP